MSGLRPFREVKLQWLQQLSRDRDLSENARSVALYIVTTHLNGHTGKAWPSYHAIAGRALRPFSALSVNLKSEDGAPPSDRAGRGPVMMDKFPLSLAIGWRGVFLTKSSSIVSWPTWICAGENSLSEHIAGRDLINADEIMRLPENRMILLRQGGALPGRGKLRYYVDPEFKGMFDHA
ncbi:hypothetical protein [Neorhizobium tomejilense]|uniref:hypothetical protein n=1 Tax=Neorhizobium tomejilense TaxID=2093828 RepID=UPI003ECEE259